MSVNDILLSVFLCLLIGLTIALIFTLLNDMGGLSAILRSCKKKEAKETKVTNVANGVDLNDISLDCVVNIDAVENHIDSTLSRLKRELNCYEKDTRWRLSKIPTRIRYYDVDADSLHEKVDELIKYMKLFDRLSKTSKTEIEKE